MQLLTKLQRAELRQSPFGARAASWRARRNTPLIDYIDYIASLVNGAATFTPPKSMDGLPAE